MLTKKMLEDYKKQNPRKYKLKEKELLARLPKKEDKKEKDDE